MPIYEYECEKCHHQLEALQKISDKPLRECPECGRHALKRLVSAPLFRLAGSGWYETDFKSDKENRRNLAGKDEAPAAETSPATKDDKPASTDTKTSTESKPAPASTTATESRTTTVTRSVAKASGPSKSKAPVKKPAAKKKVARRR
jgi:putative FmdB family regulatory protein